MTNSLTATRGRSESSIAAVFALFLTGAVLVFIAGFANATPLHSPAHDARHANGFACH
ncbi:MAG: CbtB-domain containing protein [Maritimibacter sp.]|nr:CbtB-domain containing protein [Maritimibacter sp.]